MFSRSAKAWYRMFSRSAKAWYRRLWYMMQTAPLGMHWQVLEGEGRQQVFLTCPETLTSICLPFHKTSGLLCVHWTAQAVLSQRSVHPRAFPVHMLTAMHPPPPPFMSRTQSLGAARWVWWLARGHSNSYMAGSLVAFLMALFGYLALLGIPSTLDMWVGGLLLGER